MIPHRWGVCQLPWGWDGHRRSKTSFKQNISAFSLFGTLGFCTRLEKGSTALKKSLPIVLDLIFQNRHVYFWPFISTISLESEALINIGWVGLVEAGGKWSILSKQGILDKVWCDPATLGFLTKSQSKVGSLAACLLPGINCQLQSGERSGRWGICLGKGIHFHWVSWFGQGRRNLDRFQSLDSVRGRS